MIEVGCACDATVQELGGCCSLQKRACHQRTQLGLTCGGLPFCAATDVGHITPCRPTLPVHPPHKLQVTSFSTQADTRLIPVDASVHMVGRQKSKDMVRSAGDTAGCATLKLHCHAAFTVPGRAAQPAPMICMMPRLWMPSWSNVCACGPMQKWRREGATWAQARASNASRRDFTVNGLLYEPFR